MLNLKGRGRECKSRQGLYFYILRKIQLRVRDQVLIFPILKEFLPEVERYL